MGQVFQMRRDQRHDDIAVRHLVRDLEQQAFAEIFRGTSDGIEPLNQTQRHLGVHLRNLFPVELHHFRQRGR